MLFERGSSTLTLREAILSKQIEHRIQDESEPQVKAISKKKNGEATEDDMKKHNSFFSPFHSAGQQAFSRQT